jgi:hypothetical protein
LVKVITPVVESPFGFFEVGEEGVGANAAQPRQTSFGITPKRFDSVDVAASPGKFILAMMDTVVFIALKNQSIISTPSIGEDCAFGSWTDMPLNHLQKFAFRAVGQGGTDNSSSPFEKADNWNFLRRTAPSNASNHPWSKVAFIHFHTPGKGRCFGMSLFTDALAKQPINAVRGVLVDSSNSTCFEGLHIGAKELQNRTKFTL